MENEPSLISELRFEREEFAKEYIKLLEEALRLNADLNDSREATEELVLAAKEAADRVIIKPEEGELPFKLMVRLSGETRGQTSEMWHIKDPHAHEFEATNVTGIDPVQVDFFSANKHEYFTAFGHQMTISPIFDS